eukprot:57792_1
MALHLQADSGIVYYYTSAIGSILAFLVIITLLLQTLHHYIHQFYLDNGGKGRNKMVYILFFLICIISTFICTQYAFIQSNLFTAKSITGFTESQCAVSQFSSLASIIIGSMCVYTLLIHRISIAFEGSAYAYSKKLLYTLHALLFIGSAGCLTFLCIAMPKYRFVLYYFNSTRHLLCTAEAAEHDLDTHRAHIHLDDLGAVLFISLQIVYNLILLYLFTKRLYSLQSAMVRQHLQEMNSISTHSRVPTDDVHDMDVDMATPQENIEMNTPEPKLMITVKSVLYLAESENDIGAKRIIKWHKLIKKHTILIVTIICASLMWLALNYFVSDWFWIEIVWILMINNICIWLMFAHTEKYWIFTTNYCFCYVCYYARCCTKKDIQSRTCGLFC